MSNITKEEQIKIQLQFHNETGYEWNQALNGYIWWLEEKIVQRERLNEETTTPEIFKKSNHWNAFFKVEDDE
jgi:hypothetical protein